MTLPEILLWQALRGRAGGGRKFRRRAPFGRWILDFYCPEAKLAVEVDGWSHDMSGQADRDQGRDTWLDERGVRVLRFEATEVMKNMDAVTDTIAAAPG